MIGSPALAVFCSVHCFPAPSQPSLFETIPNDGRGDCGPASLWQLIYGGNPTKHDLKALRWQAVDEVGKLLPERREKGTNQIVAAAWRLVHDVTEPFSEPRTLIQTVATVTGK